MPGYEVIGEEERDAINSLFDANGGVLFAHGFVGIRKNIFKVREFESAISKAVNSNSVNSSYCQVVSSGTAALVVALRAMGIKPGDEVITSCFTFIATVEAILEVGAKPVLAEIDQSYNLDPKSVEQLVTSKTKAIIPVHMAGAACRMDEILSIAKQHNISVLEDAAQAFGAEYKGKLLGTLGDIGAYSFDFGKSITTGEGGAIVTNSKDLFEKSRALHDHGHEYNPAVPRGRDTRSFPGLNYRMTELQAVIGLVQLGKLRSIIDSQKKNYEAIYSKLTSIPAEFRELVDSHHLHDCIIFSLENKATAEKVVLKLGEYKLGTKNIPDAIDWHFAGTWSHLANSSSEFNGCENKWKRSRELLQRSVAIPININMSNDELTGYPKAIKEALGV